MIRRHQQALFAVLDRGVAATAGLMVIFALTRLLGAKLYGVFILAETIQILLALAIEQSPGQALIFLTANKDDENAFNDALRSVLWVKLLTFLALYALLELVAPWIAAAFDEPQLTALLRVLPLSTAGLILLGTANQVLTVRQRLQIVARNDALMFACLAFFFAGGWLLGLIDSPLSGMIALVLGRLAAGALATLSVLPVWRNALWGVRATHVREALRFGVLSLANTLGVFVYTKADILLLGLLASKASVGVYGACVAALAYYRVVADAMNLIVFPRIAARREEAPETVRRSVAKLYAGGVAFGVAMGLPASLAIFYYHETLLRLVFGEEYVAGAAVLIVFGVWGLLLPFYRLAGSVLNGLGHPGDNAKTTLLVGAINVALNVPLILWLDMFGAALASIASNVIGMTLLVRHVVRRTAHS
ncbi:MAG TPA: oligosaccharide flippase family protein [bacterium]|nr:oligosaccharide flippase family protein [bacterium]